MFDDQYKVTLQKQVFVIFCVKLVSKRRFTITIPGELSFWRTLEHVRTILDENISRYFHIISIVYYLLSPYISITAVDLLFVTLIQICDSQICDIDTSALGIFVVAFAYFYQVHIDISTTMNKSLLTKNHE